MCVTINSNAFLGAAIKTRKNALLSWIASKNAKTTKIAQLDAAPSIIAQPRVPVPLAAK
jgi:hypothetical protein